ncbi:MAG TPA: ABC transporter ATP-binding protein [Candidatus Ozemobacteraceae bacterium]|nr:ABC transporter ATP-binding protein [Candidatus Ozemobacteraceae bacterium]
MNSSPGMAEPDNGLAVTRLCRHFGDVQAVADVSFEVRPGEIFGIVGPDGAGKTTLFRLLCGALDIDSGEARVGPFDVRRDPESVKSIIGYMSQRFSLYGDLTVAENIHFTATLFHVSAADRQERERQLLAASRMEPFRHRLARDLSGGMKQKLALTCALIHRPRILFLDEPTTGVDPVSRRDFWKILYQLVRQGMTLVVSTPYMDEAERCNRVAFMNAGRLLCCASPRELKANGHGSLVEVDVRPVIPARHVVAALPFVQSVHVFGNRLHVRLAEPGEPARHLADALSRSGLDYRDQRVISPSLEDVFISLVTEPVSPAPQNA